MTACTTITDVTTHIMDTYMGTYEPSAVEQLRAVESARRFWNPATGALDIPDTWDVTAAMADESIRIDWTEARNMHAMSCMTRNNWVAPRQFVHRVTCAADFADHVIELIGREARLSSTVTVYDALCQWWTVMGPAEDLEALTDGPHQLDEPELARLAERYA